MYARHTPRYWLGGDRSMLGNIVRVLALSAAITGLGACQFSPDIPTRAIDYNRAVAHTTNEILLLNIMRASDREPRYFTRLGTNSAQSGVTGGVSLSLPVPERGQGQRRRQRLRHVRQHVHARKSRRQKIPGRRNAADRGVDHPRIVVAGHPDRHAGSACSSHRSRSRRQSFRSCAMRSTRSAATCATIRNIAAAATR